MKLYKNKMEQNQKEILVTGLLNSDTGLPDAVKDISVQKLKEMKHHKSHVCPPSLTDALGNDFSFIGCVR